MTDTKSAQEKAEEARIEAKEACNLAARDRTVFSERLRREAIAAIDRYGLLARLAQAEKAVVDCPFKAAFHKQERDRLRREVEEVERGK